MEKKVNFFILKFKKSEGALQEVINRWKINPKINIVQYVQLSVQQILFLEFIISYILDYRINVYERNLFILGSQH